MSMNDNELVIQLSGICKNFGGVKALQNVGFDIRKGDIHAIVGENGAGKTTLINILCGILKRDSGEIIIKGLAYRNITPAVARRIGIAVIPQKLNIFPDLSVAENLFINNWPKKKASKIISWTEMKSLSRDLLEKFGLAIDTSTSMGSLSYVDQQMVEITRMLFAEKADIIILDEPTACLVANEIQLLFDFIKNLQGKGISFLYISHYLDEVFKICTKATVLRDGNHVLTKETKSLTMKELVRSMVGEELDLFPKRNSKIGEVLLEVRNLRKRPMLKDVNIILRKGEILGLAGLKGSGRTEIARSVCGLDDFDGGTFCINGNKAKIGKVRDALDLGIGYLSEDRIKWGLILNRPMKENVTLTFIRKLLTRFGLVNLKKEKQVVESYISKFGIKTTGINQECGALSGGNQQKVVISKLLGADLKVIFFDDPTFGVDVKAKTSVHQFMNEFVAEGRAIVLISSDVMELVSMSDRVITLSNGEIKEEYSKDEIDENKLLKILGVK